MRRVLVLLLSVLAPASAATLASGQAIAALPRAISCPLLEVAPQHWVACHLHEPSSQPA